MPVIASFDKVDNLCGRCSDDVTCLYLVIPIPLWNALKK